MAVLNNKVLPGSVSFPEAGTALAAGGPGTALVQAGPPILMGVQWGLQHPLVTLGPFLKGCGRAPGFVLVLVGRNLWAQGLSGHCLLL